MAAAPINLGGPVQFSYLGAVGRRVRWSGFGAVVKLDFELGFVKVFEGADLGSLLILQICDSPF